LYNAHSCAECHQNPVTGSSSQISELRAGGLIYGEAIQVPVLEQPGATSIGRFGWKDHYVLEVPVNS